ncbi:hypothetical protein GCM10028796_26340 [Ramlibacter monticola]|uniref:Uncharacterized protein n=1 Tax=Ramlibacter monticola TaxID=1926872 RepID=A0A936Z2R0_9BURK|nr:hypothetical protein [Ramlibacter monticola]MBL0393688.1 hypothetical protein [Ramlibacter monticola]
MPRVVVPLELAAAKLIVAIQREWNAEAGGPGGAESEEVMRSAHALRRAARAGTLAGVLGSASVSQYLGRSWVNSHPRVWPSVQVLECMALAPIDP